LGGAAIADNAAKMPIKSTAPRAMIRFCLLSRRATWYRNGTVPFQYTDL
jgi:hypothetical protein